MVGFLKVDKSKSAAEAFLVLHDDRAGDGPELFKCTPQYLVAYSASQALNIDVAVLAWL